VNNLKVNCIEKRSQYEGKNYWDIDFFAPHKIKKVHLKTEEGIKNIDLYHRIWEFADDGRLLFEKYHFVDKYEVDACYFYDIKKRLVEVKKEKKSGEKVSSTKIQYY